LRSISNQRWSGYSPCRAGSAVLDARSSGLSGEKVSAIGILYDVRERTPPSLNFPSIFAGHGLPVPEIYAEDLSHGAYLEEDSEDTTLFEFLSKNRAGEEHCSQKWLRPNSARLWACCRAFRSKRPRFEFNKVCYPRASFDHQSISWDLNYFKYYFLKLAGIPFNEQELEDDFGRLTEFLLTARLDYFLYRIFNRATSCCATASHFSWIIKAGAKERCNMTSLLSCTMLTDCP